MIILAIIELVRVVIILIILIIHLLFIKSNTFVDMIIKKSMKDNQEQNVLEHFD